MFAWCHKLTHKHRPNHEIEETDCSLRRNHSEFEFTSRPASEINYLLLFLFSFIQFLSIKHSVSASAQYTIASGRTNIHSCHWVSNVNYNSAPNVVNEFNADSYIRCVWICKNWFDEVSSIYLFFYSAVEFNESCISRTCIGETKGSFNKLISVQPGFGQNNMAQRLAASLIVLSESHRIAFAHFGSATRFMWSCGNKWFWVFIGKRNIFSVCHQACVVRIHSETFLSCWRVRDPHEKKSEGMFALDASYNQIGFVSCSPIKIWYSTDALFLQFTLFSICTRSWVV